MERFRNCEIYISKDTVKRLAYYKLGSLKELIKQLGISKARYYEIVSTPHESIDAPCIKKISSILKTNSKEFTYKENK